MHGSAKQRTPGSAHAGSGSVTASATQAHGASLQYDDHVRQSSSRVHAPGPEGAEGCGALSDGAAPLDGVLPCDALPSATGALGGGGSPAGLTAPGPRLRASGLASRGASWVVG